MSISDMSSREKAVVAVLAVVIILALCGIVLLGYRLITREESTADISVAGDATVQAAPAMGATVTPIPPLSLEELEEPVVVTTGSEPVEVARQQSVGPLAPVMIASHPLQGGHSYRVEIANADGSAAPIRGQWSQSATSASGQVAAPQIEFFESTTPHTFDVTAPVPDPNIWGISVSAGPEGLGAKSPLVITIWDVTGSQ